MVLSNYCIVTVTTISLTWATFSWFFMQCDSGNVEVIRLGWIRPCLDPCIDILHSNIFSACWWSIKYNKCEHEVSSQYIVLEDLMLRDNAKSHFHSKFFYRSRSLDIQMEWFVLMVLRSLQEHLTFQFWGKFPSFFQSLEAKECLEISQLVQCDFSLKTVASFLCQSLFCIFPDKCSDK